MPDLDDLDATFALTATQTHIACARSLAGPWPGPNTVVLAAILAGQWLRLIAAENGIVLLCERCGRAFHTNMIRDLCETCQAQEADHG